MHIIVPFISSYWPTRIAAQGQLLNEHSNGRAHTHTHTHTYIYIYTGFKFNFMAWQHRVCRCLLIFEALWSTCRHITLDSTPLDEWSARRRDLYLTTQHSQQTDNHTPGGIRNLNPRKRVVAYSRLWPHGRRDRLQIHGYCTIAWQMKLN